MLSLILVETINEQTELQHLLFAKLLKSVDQFNATPWL